MDLTTIQYEIQRTGSDVFCLVPGDVLKIETTLAVGGGDEKLIYTVPVGKTRSRIAIKITIDEETGEEGT